MNQLLQFFLLLPLLGFFASTLLSKKKENWIANLAILISSVQLLGLIIFTIYWAIHEHPILDDKHWVLFNKSTIEIFIDFFFDTTTAVYAITGASLTLLVSIFSRFYLHREEGFKRFFSTLLLFFVGYNILIFSGNFETLFIGWEILGVCSFLLIAFYRDRYLPIKNALKTISVYRVGDVCLLLAMWMSHHLWHENITFIKLTDSKLVAEHLLEHNWYGIFIAGMIVIAALVKSAQFPFSSWLPRAMEGPTTSSAIFYGSLSVHMGVFLMIRTYPYWENMVMIKALIITMGIATSIIASGISSVQSSVKTQIAYSSVAQIGLMFAEVALGFHWLALVHFSGNAFLRTYQLLVSPSVLSYRIHDMFFNFSPNKLNTKKTFFTKISNSFYILNVKEWNLDQYWFRFGWSPFKWLGKNLQFLTKKTTLIALILFYGLGLAANEYRETLPAILFEWLPFLYSFAGLLMILKSFSERGDALNAWVLIITGQFFITLSVVLLNEDFGFHHIAFFLSGSLTAAVVGYFCLRKMKSLDQDILLNRYHGYSYGHPKMSLVFLICCLGMVGLPFTPTFIGIDLLFSHIHKHQEILIIFTSISFLFLEVAVLRIYARIFLGQHKNKFHPIAYRSS